MKNQMSTIKRFLISTLITVIVIIMDTISMFFGDISTPKIIFHGVYCIALLISIIALISMVSKNKTGD